MNRGAHGERWELNGNASYAVFEKSLIEIEEIASLEAKQFEVRDDLRHMPVLVPDVIDYRLPPMLADVHIDVRQIMAIRVHEPLKVQLVAKWVRRRQAQAVSHHRRATTATGTTWDSL